MMSWNINTISIDNTSSTIGYHDTGGDHGSLALRLMIKKYG
jgi:hypothetical protein